ncbi:MAG: aminotransferase class III-fold pyridoxal phosphate-dependent enzyme [Kordiimonadaceae bacterium]|nr:aminotransferase class III-fold pyridoxal phosphate-dependent enzyme [Kordiimonadaceae bacterium]
MSLDDFCADGPKGQGLWKRAEQVLPGGGVYLTRSADFAGRGVVPGFIEEADGCRLVDVDGRKYIDFLGANGPNLLGYCHPEIEEAVRRQAAKGVSVSFFSPSMIETVEGLLDYFSGFDWGLLSKTGSETLTFATRVAKQHTQRDHLVAFDSAYHGSAPELAILPPSGPLTRAGENVHRIAWNDAEALEALGRRVGDKIAGVLLNPLDQNPRQITQDISDDFRNAISAFCDRYGSLLILDDVRHGFRLHPEGSHKYVGLEPDILCLGKALGNGYALSAVLAKEEFRSAAQSILYTSTHHFETSPMRAALKTLEIYQRDNVFEHISRAGEQLRAGFVTAAEKSGHAISYSGPVTMPTFLFQNDPKCKKLRLFSRKAAEKGAIFHPSLNWNLSLAHTTQDIDEAVKIAAAAMSEMPV